MASLIEIMQLCRLCLVKDQVNIPIFEEQGDIRQIFLKISACLPVKVSREDNLPKKICDTCSSKLESLYQFWNTSANSEKQLLKWLSQVGVEKTSGRVAQSHSINSDGVVLKQEVVELADTHSVDDDLAPDDLNISNDAHDYILQQQQLPYQPLGFQFQQDGFTEGEGTSSTSGPSATVTSEAADAPKRKRRAAAMKALPAHIDSEEEDEDDVDMVETKIAKTEEQTDESGAEDPEPTAFVGVPSTSADNEQPGPSGVGKGAAEATCSQDPLPVGRNILYEALQNPLHKTKHPEIIKILGIKPELIEIKCDPSEFEESGLNNQEVDFSKLGYTLKVKNNKKAEEKYECHICNDGVQMKKKELTKHFRTNHPGRYARFHKKFAQMQEIHTCEICSKEFKSIKVFEEHMETHDNQYICETCNQSFKKILDYTLHVFTHSDDKIYKCQLCDYKSESKACITAHVDCFHEMKMKYKCETCGKRFNVSTWFEEHKYFHTGERPFVCEFCGKSFPYTRYLKCHKTSIHKELMTGKPNEIKCEICGKQYKHKNNLKLHMLLHTGKSPICDVCGKQITTPEKLKFHMRLHTGYKPFICGYCPQAFAIKPRLVEHERTHTGERPYLCKFCGKGFTQRASRTIHERGHTGEKPYSCHLCTKGFAAKSQVTLHLKNCQGVLPKSN